jgi:hypothetical protein
LRDFQVVGDRRTEPSVFEQRWGRLIARLAALDRLIILILDRNLAFDVDLLFLDQTRSFICLFSRLRTPLPCASSS